MTEDGFLVNATTPKDAFGLAFRLAEKAFFNDEVPVGAVVVYQGQIVGEASNEMASRRDPTAHAELLAIARACKKLGNERLVGGQLFTTLEPCCMCTGAILFARLEKVHYLATEKRLPALTAVLGLKGHNHMVEVRQCHFPEYPAGQLLVDFFKAKRQKR